MSALPEPAAPRTDVASAGAAHAPRGATSLRIYLDLGRVSNVPTVWSNVVAGMVLAGAPMRPSAAAALGMAMSLFYVGGMYLNDAFDRRFDAVHRPERPIPSGRISARRVFAIGFGLLAGGLALLAPVAIAARAEGSPLPALGSGCALAAAIVVYDAWHKGNPASPLLMGLCRMLVYVTAGLAAGGRFGAPLAAGAAVLFAYLIGLTYVAKQETLARVGNLWPLAFLLAPFAYAPAAMQRGAAATSAPALATAAAIFGLFAGWVARAVARIRARTAGAIPRAVVALIAGISLCDALLVAASGHPVLALAAALAFPATLLAQRWVAGT